MPQEAAPPADEIALVQQASPTTMGVERVSGQARCELDDPVAQQVVEADSRYIVDRGVHGGGPAGNPAWPDSAAARAGHGSRPVGKTASMIGVAALALDAGVDILVVLAGTRISLWRQTYSRLLEQLDGYDQPRTSHAAGQDLRSCPWDHDDATARRRTRCTSCRGPRPSGSSSEADRS